MYWGIKSLFEESKPTEVPVSAGSKSGTATLEVGLSGGKVLVNVTGSVGEEEGLDDIQASAMGLERLKLLPRSSQVNRPMIPVTGSATASAE